MDIVTLRDYLHSTKNDWNYITPIEFYNEYYVTPFLIENAHFHKCMFITLFLQK
jgi:hypothetical protein